MSVLLEHANLCVPDIDRALKFIQTAFPEFRIRADKTDPDGSRWVHVGTDKTYLALNQATGERPEPWVPYAGKPGLNHLAYVVDDVDAIRERLTAAGYPDSTVVNNHPYRKRIYFHDEDGNDWEFVQYLSDDPAQRNDYEIPDK